MYIKIRQQKVRFDWFHQFRKKKALPYQTMALKNKKVYTQFFCGFYTERGRSTPNKLCRRIFFLFSLLFLSFAAFSQADTSKIKEVIGLSFDELLNLKITTASKKSEKISEAPATVYVITQEDIKLRGYVFLKDVLRDLPGMETIENYNSEQGTLVPVRGIFGNNKIIVLLNGRRVNPPGGEEMMFRNNINILQAKQIEIIYGLGSTLYGQDAINAVINIITEEATDKMKVDVMGRGGMYNNKEGVISLSSRLSGSEGKYVGISASLSYADDGLSSLDKEYPKWWNDNYKSIALKTGIRTTPYRFDSGINAFIRIENEKSSLQVWHSESSRSSSEGGYAPILQYTNEAIWHDRTTVISGTNDFRMTDKINLNSSISYSRYEIDPESRYVFPINDSTIFLNDFKYGIGSGLRVEEQFNFEINKKISLVGGVLAAFNDIIPKATIPGGAKPGNDVVSQGGAFVYYTIKGDSLSRVELPRAYNLNYSNYGSYVEARYVFTDKFKTIIGFRADADTRYKELPLSPRIAIIYDPDKHLNFKYVFNMGYVSPSPFFGYHVFDDGQAILTFNADLKAESATSNELNISYRNNKFSMTTAFYYNNQENLIVVEDGRINPANLVKDTIWVNPDGTGPRQLIKTANSGKTKALGTDVFARYKSDKFSLWASFSYVNFEHELNHVITGLNNISTVNVRLGISFTPVKKISITPSLIFRTTPENVKQTFGLDQELKNPYAINVHINYEPVKRLAIFIDGQNITNHKYALKGIIGPMPQEPIRVLAGIRYIIK